MISNFNSISLRKQRLKAFCSNFLKADKLQTDNVKEFISDLQTLTPEEALLLMGWISQQELFPSQHIKRSIDKITNLIYKPLKANSAGKSFHHTFLKDLYESNNSLLTCLQSAKSCLKLIMSRKINVPTVELFHLMQNLRHYTSHLEIVERKVFPQLTKLVPPSASCLAYEKLFHSDFLVLIQQLNCILNNGHFKTDTFNTIIGKLYFRIHLTIYRQNLIFFPVYEQWFL